MDSLTQIVLGAACGEIALGKKIGNKALLFGAIGATIPDIDVFIGRLLYSNEIEAMAFHRGFMHSILFAFLAAIFFGILVYTFYNTGKRRYTTSYKDWIYLFFISIFTHPILDCFTPYGTQLFAPFSDYRVAFNTIAVADPLYTLPFLLCIIIVMFFKRSDTRRKRWLNLGFYISSAYLIFTVGNKLYIDSVFKKSFKNKRIAYHRFSAQPTILNNILWYAVAESDTQYHLVFYSLFDENNISEEIIAIDKNHDLINMAAPNLKKLVWFSNGYFHLSKKDKVGTYKYVDLRYPMLNPKDVNTAVFNFTVFFKGGKWDILPFAGSPPNRDDFLQFVTRIKGI